MRKRRQQFFIENRKHLNSNLFSKHRSTEDDSENQSMKEHMRLFLEAQRDVLIENLKTKTFDKVLSSLIAIRNVMSVSQEIKELPLDDFFELGLLDPVLQCLKPELNSQCKEIPEEAVWIIANASCCESEYLSSIAQTGILQIFHYYLANEIYESLFYNIFWTLANFVTESIQYRTIIFKEGLFQSIFKISNLVRKTQNRTREVICWFFEACMFGGNFPVPQLEEDILSELLIYVRQDLPEITMGECLCGIASYLSKKFDQRSRIMRISQENLEPVFLKIIEKKVPTQTTPMLTIFSRLTQGNSFEIKKFYSPYFVKVLGSFIEGKSMKDILLALEILSNLVTTIDSCFEDMLKIHLIDLICEKIMTNKDYSITHYSIEFFKSVVYRQKPNEVDLLVNNYELIGLALESLKHPNIIVVISGLELLEALIYFGEDIKTDENLIVKMILKKDDFENFAKLHFHPNQRVANLSTHISNKFDLY